MGDHGDKADTEINLGDPRSPRPSKPKKSKSSSTPQLNFGTVMMHVKANPFIVGILIGLVFGAMIVYASLSVQLDKAQLDLLRVKLQHKKEASSFTGPKCPDQAQLQAEVEKLEKEAEKAKFTIQEYALRCLQCNNASAAVSENTERMEKEHSQTTAQLQTELDKLKAEKVIWEREKIELTKDIKGTVAETFKTAKENALKDLEGHKRTLEVAHHVEVTELKSKSEKAERQFAMAQQDRDQAIKDAKTLEEEKLSCTGQLLEAKNGRNGEMDKVMGEMEALSGAVAECQKTAAAHENSVCELCNHCPSVNFPVCHRCHRGRGL
mmetsp:Transcript_14228/g.30462  ORF Transcript_14228/g.30462 Transcript_14228/m.30462 type:complete len:323 (-) Transcript_14228:151-1119(-)|eukprot:CAMPEP_0118938374 /NCGR_PEP_ID=MMETSP1169-20130426/25640_1 /TAXON_ID=36882 /ORGANISM="Pyramimonas obovata, Strain CCMP722" /LENGTH=322 /DNA_ID=CAMNT_0006882279 /DNA_START=70 /DNA_END=1038 /DNA_ORIENTATION=+